MAVMLLGGVNFVWAATSFLTTMTGQVGTNDNAEIFYYATKKVKIAAGETYVYTLTNFNNANNSEEWKNWLVEGNLGDKYFDCEARGHKWQVGGANEPVYTPIINTSDVANWQTAYNGATVTVTISRNPKGDQFTITHTSNVLGTTEGNTDKYYGGTFTVAVGANEDWDIYLTEENSHFVVNKVVYTNASGVFTMYKTVDLSLFDDNSTYSDGTASFQLANKQWSKLDLSSYYSDISGIITNVKLNFTENIGTGGRMCFGVFGNNKSAWGNGAPETANAVSTWGVCGTSNANRVYYCNSCSNVNTLTVGSAQNIEIDMDMVNKSFTFIQGSTTLVNKQAFVDSYIAVPKYFAGHTWTNESNTTTLSNMTIEVVYRDASYFVDECKTYETSAAFATYIDGLYDAGSLNTVEDVFAAHSAWQVAQAQANGLTDYSKAIMNRTFELHNTDGWVINGDVATGASTDKDKYGEVEYGEGWSQYYTGWNGRNVSQKIATLPAGTYRLTAKVYSTSGSGAPVRLFANGQLSDAEAGDDHDPVLDFIVTGNEENIKIGIGGTGKNNDTDNTWGTWWYRVKNFTLTRTAVSGTITSAGWSTFASSYPLDLSTLTAAHTPTAYYASAASGSKVTLTSTTATVPAGEGIMIKGTAGETFTIDVAESGTAIDGNLLKGQTTTGNVAASTAGTYHYVFGFNTADPSIYGFYNLASATSVPAGKAYLETTTELTAGARISIVFEDETTGISLTENSELRTENAVYDLQGRRVAQPQKGLYIVNGKKFVKK